MEVRLQSTDFSTSSPDFPGVAHNHKPLKGQESEQGGTRGSVRRCRVPEAQRDVGAGFEDGVKKCGWPLEAREGKEMDLTPEKNGTFLIPLSFAH